MRRRGFTVIETMLFLAISAALTIAIITTTGASIGAQRYKDAVATLQSDIQQQYEDAISIKNQRYVADALPSGCTSGSVGVGQTRCVIMGKTMSIRNDGRISQYVVYGVEPASISETADEYTVMRSYTPRVIPSSIQDSNMEWQTGIAWPISGSGARPAGTARDISILVIRSPRSGTVYTFTKDDLNVTSSTALRDMINDTTRGRKTICIESSGWVNRNGMSVTISDKASTAGAIEVRTNDLMTEAQC